MTDKQPERRPPFEELYRRNFQMVYRICYTYMKNPHDAEDCTEDTFLRALSHPVCFETLQHEQGWLTVTAMNICKDKLKHWWSRLVVPLEEYEHSDASVVSSENGVLDAMMALPAKHKDVILLYYFHGYSTDEISKLLGRPASTVRNQLRDARKKLEVQLGVSRLDKHMLQTLCCR